MAGGAQRTGEHVVQFYEEESYLVEIVGQFLAAGASAGGGLIVVATAPHQAHFCRALDQRGHDAAALLREDRLVLLDARATLSHLLVDGLPDPRRFADTFQPLLARFTQGGHRVHVYGEMVDLLWRDGNAEAAIRLEELWNETGKARAFVLLCGYALGNFRQQEHEAPYARICAAHSQVFPSESFSALPDADARLREVSLLQQRAATLEAEIARRARVEEALLSAVRVRDDFLSAAGHELRTPLTALLLQAQTLASAIKSGQRPDLPSRLGKLETLALRLADLVDTLLDVSLVTSGGSLSLAPTSADLTSIVRDVLARMEDDIRGAGCRARFVAEQPVMGEWDERRLAQLVACLLSNAIKFGRGGPVDVSVRISDQRALLSVRDEGLGLSAADQERIFDRFERAIPRNHFGGFGLGLWIAKQIVEAHGGDIRVQSAPGAGATFTVSMPLRPHA